MHINPDKVIADARASLEEDVGSGDISADLIPPHTRARAELISREPMIVAGIPWVNAVFELVDPEITLEWCVRDGDWLSAPSTLCWIEGSAKKILTAERAALNFLQTLSGTATQTRHYVNELKNSKTLLLDTRKTLPGLRCAQKYAVTCGGGHNHRMGLFDAFLIKENHIKAAGSITLAIQKARSIRDDVLLEIEVENLTELREALEAMPDRILLDNFSLTDLREAVLLDKPKDLTLEVSGGVTLSTLAAIAETGVDYISVGAITKSVQAIDLSILIRTICT